MSEHDGDAIDADQLLALYREMARARALDDVVIRLAERRAFQGFYHPGRGQEAVQVAVCRQLRPADAVFYAHRGFGYLTSKGMDPAAILGDVLGTTAGSTAGLGAGTVHCVAPDLGIFGQGGTLGSCFPLATGVALARQLQRRDDIAVAFFGDGASARGTFLESAVVAVARKLPVVYVCENNGLAISVTPLESQGTTTIAPRAAGFGMPAVSVDGCDVEAVHHAARGAIERARAGDGPSFIETMTSRVLGHFSGDLEPYRDVKPAVADDPIDRVVKTLIERGLDQSSLDAVAAAARDEMEAAAEKAAAAPHPGPERLFEGLWA